MSLAQAAVAVQARPGKAVNPLCFLLDDDFVFRQELAKELRRDGIDVVEFSSSMRLTDMVEDQDPDIVFVNLNQAAPHECVRALLALKESGFAGAVQLFGRCDVRLLASLNTVGADCALKMLEPIQKPIKAATIQRIVMGQKLGTPAAGPAGVFLSDAILRNMIKFFYQLKFDLRSRTMIGAEVMARAVHPEHGLLPPDQFLRGADDDSLLKLSQLALINALGSAAHFQQAGVALQLAINISVENLLRLPIVELVTKYRPEGDWPGLLLEVPERQVINKIELLKGRAAKLQEAKVALAIDNFGRGSSSLHALKEMPFAEIKIDRSLVEGCAGDEGNGRICKSLIQMAHNFGCRAVAVGISTEADLKTLSDFDCDLGQGFLFSKPMDVQQIDALIANSKKAN